MKEIFAPIFCGDGIRGHCRLCSHGEPLLSQPRCRKNVPEMQALPLGKAECNTQPCRRVGRVITGQHRAATTNVAATAATSVAAAAMAITDKSCARAATANNKLASLD